MYTLLGIWALTAIASCIMMYYHNKLIYEVFKINKTKENSILDYAGAIYAAPVIMWMLIYITLYDLKLRRNRSDTSRNI